MSGRVVQLIASSVLLLCAVVLMCGVEGGTRVFADAPVATRIELAVRPGDLSFRVGTPVLLARRVVNETTDEARFSLPVTLTDATGSGNGWNVQMGSGTTLPTYVTAITVACAGQSTCTLPVGATNLAAPLGINGSSAVTVLNAQRASGMGQFSITLEITTLLPHGEEVTSGLTALTFSLLNGAEA